MPGANPNAFKTGSLKSKLLNLAQTSVYQVKVQPPEDIRKFINQTGRKFNYDKKGENMELMCHETSLPGTSLSTHEVTNDYPGVREKMAYRRMYDDTLDMTFYVDKEYGVIEFFEGWVDYISGMNVKGVSDGDSRNDYRTGAAYYRMNYPHKYKAPIYVTKFEKDMSDAALTYEFVDAFPINLISIPISYAASEVMKLSVSFSYTRYVRYRSTDNVLENYDDFFKPKDERKLPDQTLSGFPPSSIEQGLA